MKSFEEEFPSLKSKRCVQHGIRSSADFIVANSDDYEKMKAALNSRYYRESDVQKHCLDKQRVKEVIDQQIKECEECKHQNCTSCNHRANELKLLKAGLGLEA